MCNLGCNYRMGRGVPKDLTLAYDLFVKAAELGDLGGTVNVGVALYQGRGVARDEKAGVMWYIRAFQSCARGEPMWQLAAANLGIAAVAGRGMPDGKPNFELALRTFAMAGDVPLVLLYHGTLLEQGKGLPGGKPDLPGAFAKYKAAAAANLPQALYPLGRCYETGIGVAPDRTLALATYMRGAELGDEHCIERVQHMMQPM